MRIDSHPYPGTVLLTDYPGERKASLDALVSTMRDERPAEAVSAFLNSRPDEETLYAGVVALLHFHDYHALVDAAYGRLPFLLESGALDAMNPGVAMELLGRLDQSDLVAQRLETIPDGLAAEIPVSMVQASLLAGMAGHALVLRSWFGIEGAEGAILVAHALALSGSFEEAIEVLDPWFEAHAEAGLLAYRCQTGASMRDRGLAQRLERAHEGVPWTYVQRFFTPGQDRLLRLNVLSRVGKRLTYGRARIGVAKAVGPLVRLLRSQGE